MQIRTREKQMIKAKTVDRKTPLPSPQSLRKAEPSAESLLSGQRRGG
jgi:hypothetical protein